MEEARKKLVLHENSRSHRESFMMWKEAERRISLGLGIDAHTDRSDDSI